MVKFEFLCFSHFLSFQNLAAMEGADSDAPTAPQEPIKIEIEKFTGKKTWLGGYRHKLNDKGMIE